MNTNMTQAEIAAAIANIKRCIAETEAKLENSGLAQYKFAVHVFALDAMRTGLRQYEAMLTK